MYVCGVFVFEYVHTCVWMLQRSEECVGIPRTIVVGSSTCESFFYEASVLPLSYSSAQKFISHSSEEFQPMTKIAVHSLFEKVSFSHIWWLLTLFP